MVQIKYGQSCETVADLFKQIIEEYICRQKQVFMIHSVNRVYHGSKSTSYLSSKIWKIVPVKINGFSYPLSFEREINGYHKIALAGLASNI